MVLPLLSRNTGNDETLWFPTLTSLSLLAHDWKDTARIPRASQPIEDALVRFLGTHAQHHRDASPMQSLSIRGITISEDFARKLKSLVKHVEASTIFPPCAEFGPQGSVLRCNPTFSKLLRYTGLIELQILPPYPRIFCGHKILQSGCVCLSHTRVRHHDRLVTVR